MAAPGGFWEAWRHISRWWQDRATGRGSCFGLSSDELVPFWICVFVITVLVHFFRSSGEARRPALVRGRRGSNAGLLGFWFGRMAGRDGSGYDHLLENTPQKLEAAYAPPTSMCEAARMRELCSQLGIQRDLEAACVAVLLILQCRRRYGVASLAVCDGTSPRKLHVPLNLEEPTVSFSALLQAVDRALCEPAAANGAHEEEEAAEVVFQWNAKIFESGKWCARMDSCDKNIIVFGTSSELAQSFQILFGAAAEQASANVWELPLLTKAAAQAVQAWGSPTLRLESVEDSESGRILPMPRLLASLGHADSENLAVAGDGFDLSHRELHRRAAAVAEAILFAKAGGAFQPSLGSSCGVVVYMGRGKAIAPAFLGVLQAGCHAVPADVHWPMERVRQVATASSAVMILVDAASSEAWQAAGLSSLPCLTVDEALFSQATNSAGRLEVEKLDQDCPAVILFTSGSTGVPKGIVLSHGYLTVLVLGVVKSKRMGQETRALCYHSPTWMPFLDYLFGPLLKGGCCLYFPEGGTHMISPKDLRAFGVRHGATNAGFVPAMLDVLLEQGLPPSLGDVGVGGAAVPGELCARAVAALQALRPSAVLYTGYSGTEQGDVTQLKMRVEEDVEASSSDGGCMSAGRPHGAQRCKVLDQNFQVVGPEGVGEICVSGPGLASGYLHLPEKTAETFIPSSPAFHGERMARSGDLGKWMSNGSLKVVGRRDSMVKVRGARIELGEVEVAVASHASVKATVVAVWEDQLVAYVTPAIPADLREHCKARLVPYMVPHRFEGLEELPRLPNGKVNRRALPTPAKLADGVETVMELDSLGQMRKFTRKAASEDRVLDNVRAILIAVVIQSHAIHIEGTSRAMMTSQMEPLGAEWGPAQFLLLKLVYSGGWSSLAFLSGFDDTRSMRPYGLTYREVLFILLWPTLDFVWTLWYLPVFVYMRVAFCLAHRLGLERLHLLVAAQAWIIMPAFVDLYIGWKPNGPQGECPSQCICPFQEFPQAQFWSQIIFGWWVNETGKDTGNFTRISFLGHALIFIPCYWIGFYTGGPIFRVLTRVADEKSILRRGLVAAVVFAVYFAMYKAPVTDDFSDRCAAFWGPDGSFVYVQVLKNLLYYVLNLSMSLLYVFFIAACVPVHLKHMAKVSFSALVLSGFVPCINDYAVMALHLRHWFPPSISPGVELAWIFAVPVLFVLVSGSLLTAAAPYVVRAVISALHAARRKLGGEVAGGPRVRV